MKMGAASYWQGFRIVKILSVFFLFTACAAFAKRHETFAERPSKRTEQINAARIHANREKIEVREWARSRGVAMRHDNGKRVIEAVAIRDGRPLFFTTFNNDAAVSTAADAVRGTLPFNAAGKGVTVGVWDGGSVMTNHQEFGNRVQSVDGASVHYHATHVGGTIGASGVVARAEGMAPAVDIASYDWNYAESEMTGVASSFPGETNTIHLSNHSYGILAGWFYASWMNPWTHRSGYHWWGNLEVDTADEYFGQYGLGPWQWDQIVHNAPYFLPFKAAGNERDDGPADGATVYYTTDGGSSWTNTIYDSTVHALGDGVYKNGYDTIPYLGNAKNIMTVGVVHDAESDGARNVGGASNTVFGSWGPADDGRIKPDIVANGFELYSCNHLNPSSYAVRTGSSMAAPNACGSAALLVDYYDDLHPGQAMRASTLKGLIIHTADDLGRPGPDYQFGWGLMNTREAAELLKDQSRNNAARLAEAMLSESDPLHAYTVLADAAEPIRVTLCWTDPPGLHTSELDSRSPVLINDLDLKVIGPNGTNHPYTLSYADPEVNAIMDSENNIDNVEQVYISAPVPGQYSIVVDFDGSLYVGNQWYSLLTSGLAYDQDGDSLPDNWEMEHFLNTSNGTATADADGDGYDNLSEYIAGTDPLDPDSVFGFAAAYPLPSTGEPPFVVEWNSLPGRVYNIYWTYNLIYVPFENISGEIRWPFNSYTDSVDRIGEQGFYQIDVRLDQ